MAQKMNTLEAATEICKVCCGKESVMDLTVEEVLKIKPSLFKKVAKALAEDNPEYPALMNVYNVCKDDNSMVKMNLQYVGTRIGLINYKGKVICG